MVDIQGQGCTSLIVPSLATITTRHVGLFYPVELHLRPANYGVCTELC